MDVKTGPKHPIVGMDCSPTKTPDVIDVPAILEKYRQEREKRYRQDGSHQYVEVTGELADFYETDPYSPPAERGAISDDVDVVVMGGGFAGLMAAARLTQAGVKKIRIIEMGGDFGGTWYWNRYPGVQCDVESYTYLPLCEELNYVPKERYSYGPEIYEHCQRIAHHFGLYEYALFGTTIRSLNWSPAEKKWRVVTTHGDDIRARFVIIATGPLNKPKLPGIPGIKDFKGHMFHTARWDFDYTGGDTSGGLEKLGDKRVAIIGTGSTGIQCIPYLGRYAKHLTVFQRTPSYVSERGNGPTDPDWVRSLRPGWQAIRQAAFHAVGNEPFDPRREDIICDGWSEINRNLAAKLAADGFPGLQPDELATMLEMEEHRTTERIRQLIDTVIDDKVTAEKLKPWYRYRCKRPGFNDEYLSTFNRPNVTLVDVSASKGVERITEKGLVANGLEHEADCIIFASGFEVTTDHKRRFGLDAISGRDDVSLYDYWAEGYRTLHGMMSHSFPNMFFTGFTQGVIVGSITMMYDLQATHISYIVRETLERGARSVEPSQDAQDRWVRTIRENSVDRSEFWRECTPSYFNNEGDQISYSPIFGEPFGPGYRAFENILQAWRENNTLEGMVLEE